ncbi:protein CASP [Pelomyxa schiedti]|nr:protein CASP [Pelomyxa schiedti]
MSQSTSNTFIELWKGLDLGSTRQQWDQQAASIAKNKESRQSSRKQLMDNTKEFKAASDTDKIRLVTPLITLYQEEVNRLTLGCKQAEQAFLAMQTLLSTIPDPLQVIGQLTEEKQKREARFGELEGEVKQLRSQVADYQSEFSALKNQEVTLRRYELKIHELEQKLEDDKKVQEASETRQQEYQATKEREAELNRTIETLKDELSRANTTIRNSQNAIVDMKSSFEEKLNAKQTEMDVLTAELEKESATLMALRSDMQRLRAESSQSDSNPSSTLPSEMSVIMMKQTELELQATQKDILIASLNEKLSNLEANSNSIQTNMQTKIDSLQESLKQERLEREQCTKGLPTREQYLTMVTELETYRALEAPVDAQSETLHTPNPSVEVILKEKTRRLETETMQLRARINQYEASEAEKAAALRTCEAENVRLTTLISKLEAQIDQLSAAHTSPPASPLVDVPPSASSLDQILGFSSTSTVVSNVPPSSPSTSPAVPRPEHGEGGMVAVVCEQRDRFKMKMEQLEADKVSLKQALDKASLDLSELKDDNLKLFQKIKFLQSYQSRNTGNGTVLVDIEPRTDNRASRTHTQSLEKYDRMYEQAINPFAAFDSSEKEQRYRQLNAVDKVLLRFGRYCLSHAWARKLIAVYVILLHLLVFATLYYHTSSAPPPNPAHQS